MKGLFIGDGEPTEKWLSNACHKQTDESLKETLRITDNEYGNDGSHGIYRICYNDMLDYFGKLKRYH